jgi:hypothetical protein
LFGETTERASSGAERGLRAGRRSLHDDFRTVWLTDEKIKKLGR